ncbi:MULTISPECIES: efflux RND transporter periplasmic adaptor subunit [Pseudoalteromonas]|jgi:RND family efflux transporter MFP subunit|uniref:efflux RND transporter periplasmic adaptor subunit n=1 Tax=Pseudoalteromonas TaxID=53246 RepID=UPI0002CBFC68|nr:MULTISPECIES: efflux RND transporter periplasmic adaptor subunit [Pseudoalteromonas]MAJ38645.1 efflux RND transporter periplasmic adaptor subunit [Pseudoalteromonadaceae bacterium]MCP4060389.1 efflux RND transporter periplasmic adaptor subunit [Pseudoalteromonas sp.]MDY6888385.1 efflux RND transporter periplasmic adaptor subunit [Pseudomonadota bacterium]OUX94936.1 MAG: efflux transporter periplasmic adaptor subunit [Pseudoalteromonas sp. TMED43]AZN33646.1 efflux RND transporter periplasmic|tara:strand:+ start:10543 stop:11688 length:1146 start_codon:yes stop_codon:yes gene_type:complete
MKISPVPVVVTLVAIVCIGLAISYNGQKMAQQANGPKPEPAKSVAPNVSVINAVPSTYQAYVSGHGEAKAHWALSLKAQVKGEITNMSEQFATGNVVKKGQVLAQIDNTEYLQAVASAKATLADAKLALQEEQDLGNQAKREWQRSGVTQAPSSPLVFRTLQLEAAQATADNAQYALQTAQRDEKNTHISAPFDAVILSRDVDLGTYVSIGDTLATLNSTDKVEISVPLSLSQWQNLASDKSGEVILSDVTTQNQWQGYIARFEQHLDDSSRQRSVVVALDKPFEQATPLLPGTFLAVQIAGKALNNVIKLPASAVSQEGLIWYVNEQNTLMSIQAQKLFERGDYVYISPIEGHTNLRVVARPLVSYLNDMLVNPIVEEMP